MNSFFIKSVINTVVVIPAASVSGIMQGQLCCADIFLHKHKPPGAESGDGAGEFTGIVIVTFIFKVLF